MAMEIEGEAVWPNAGYLTLLSPQFSICKMELQQGKAGWAFPQQAADIPHSQASSSCPPVDPALIPSETMTDGQLAPLHPRPGTMWWGFLHLRPQPQVSFLLFQAMP